MRTILLAALLLASLLPAVPLANASSCDITPYPRCDIVAGPASAGFWVDTRWWPLEAEFYHCVDLEGEPIVERLLCQYYRLA